MIKNRTHKLNVKIICLLLASCAGCSSPLARFQSSLDGPEAIGRTSIKPTEIADVEEAQQRSEKQSELLQTKLAERFQSNQAELHPKQPDQQAKLSVELQSKPAVIDTKQVLELSEFSSNSSHRSQVPSQFNHHSIDVDNIFDNPSVGIAQTGFGDSDFLSSSAIRPTSLNESTSSVLDASHQTDESFDFTNIEASSFFKNLEKSGCSSVSYDGLGCDRLSEDCCELCNFDSRWCRAKSTIRSDFRNYYSREHCKLMALGFGLGAIFANTDIDENFQTWYQDDVRSNSTDDFAKFVKQFGEGEYMIAAAGAAIATAWVIPQTRLGGYAGEWGDRAVRAALVGAPPMLFMQFATGASRPGEESWGSRWKPFNDTNGVSGHAFVGSLPFITAAMMTDNRLLKGGLYLSSTFTGISRINDDAHYLSQVMLGWWMSYLACRSVNNTEQCDRRFELIPLTHPEGSGLGIMCIY